MKAQAQAAPRQPHPAHPAAQTKGKQRSGHYNLGGLPLSTPPQRATRAAAWNIFIAILASVLGLALTPESGQAATTTFTPVADTYTRSDMSSTNFGSQKRLSAQASSPTRRGYLRFDVKLPAGSVVTKATLRAKSVSSAFGTGVDLRGVADNSWAENTLTYSNAPTHDPSVSYAPDYANGSWVELNATKLATGPGLVSMALTTWSSAYHGFESRESDYDPELVVEYDPPPPPSPSPAGALHSTTAEPFVDAAGRAVRLHGFNLTPVWSDKPGQTWTLARYQQIRDKGFNAVRLVLKWSDFEPTRGAFNQTHLSTLDTAIARAKAAGLYVILDEIHLYGSGGFDYVPSWARFGDSVTSVRTNAAGYLKLLAGRYRSEPAVAAYDPVNEFHRWPIDQNGVLRAYDQLIREIRTVDPGKIVLVEPTYGDTSVAGDLADFSNLTDKRNVVWSIHDYFAGGDDDGYAADGSKTGVYVYGGRTGYPSPDPRELENHLKVHVDKTRAAGLPIWIGEYGIGDGVANHAQWIKDKVALFEKYGLGRGWWEYRTTSPMSATSSDGSWKPWIGLITPGATPTPPPADTAPPETSITSGPAEGGTDSSTSASFGFSSEQGATFECRLEESPFTPCSSPKDYTGLADGPHAFEVRARDAAGNLDPTPARRTWVVDAEPSEPSPTS